MFEAFGYVDEKYILRAGKNRIRKKAILNLDTEDESLVDGCAERRWLPVLAACLVILVLSTPLLLRLVKQPDSGGMIPADGYNQPTVAFAYLYCVGIDSFDTIQEFLSVEKQGADLLNYLHTSGLEALGVKTEEDFDSLRQTLRTTPIPSLNGLEPKMDFIENEEFVYAYFNADKVETAIQKEASRAYVQEEIKDLTPVDAQWNYPIYLIEEDTVGTTLALDVNDHFVHVTVYDSNVDSAVETVKGLCFIYFVDENTTVSGENYRVVSSDSGQIQILSKELLPRSGFYWLEGDHESLEDVPCVSLNTETKRLVTSVGLTMSYAERGNYTVTGDRLVAQTQSTVLTFEIVGEDRLILVEDAQEAVGWLTEGSVFIWQEMP